MADIFDGIISLVGAIVFIAVMFFWFLPALSETNGSETLLITPSKVA